MNKYFWRYDMSCSHIISWKDERLTMILNWNEYTHSSIFCPDQVNQVINHTTYHIVFCLCQLLRQELKSRRNSLHALCVLLAKEWGVPQSIWGTASCITSLPLCRVCRPPANTPLGNIPVGVRPLSVSTLSLSSL